MYFLYYKCRNIVNTSSCIRFIFVGNANQGLELLEGDQYNLLDSLGDTNSVSYNFIKKIRY